MDQLSHFDHESFRAIGGTVIGYGLLLGVMTVLLFGIPYAVFSLV